MFKSIKEFFTPIHQLHPELYHERYNESGVQIITKSDISEPILQWCKLYKEDTLGRFTTDNECEWGTPLWISWVDTQTTITLVASVECTSGKFKILSAKLGDLLLTEDECTLVMDTYIALIEQGQVDEEAVYRDKQNNLRQELCKIYCK